MKLIASLCLGVLLVSCSGSNEIADLPVAQFYDWLALRMDEYSLAINQRDSTLELRLQGVISREAERRYDALAHDCAGPDPDKRILATFALGFTQRTEALTHLVPRLSDPIPQVKGNAAAAIAFLNPTDPPLAAIAAMLDDREAYVRHAALFALCGLLRPGQDIAFFPRLIEFLDDNDDNLRIEAARVLAKLKKKEALPALLHKGLTDGRSPLVRINSAMAIGALGGDAGEAVPLLIERLRDNEAGVVEAVYWALKKITGRDDADRSYHNWREWYDEHAKFFEYACPKHPEVIKEVGGGCPNCGMRLELRHKVDPSIEYYCPKDLDVLAPTPGKCAKCKGDLVPRRKLKK